MKVVIENEVCIGQYEGNIENDSVSGSYVVVVIRMYC